MTLLKKMFTFVVAVLVLLASTNQTNAQETSETFSTTLESTYKIDAVGIAKVTHRFKITNKTPTIFLTQYALKTSYPELQNILVRYQDQIIIPNITQDGTGTTISLAFPDQLVGQGKTRDFSVEYTSRDIASIGGQVLELHIPELPEGASYAAHTTSIEIPLSYGYPARIEPTPSGTNDTEGFLKISYDNLQGKSISAIFGQEQYYNLSLRYQLENPTSGSALAQIALPPDTTFQRVLYHTIDPQPTNLKMDADGNWIATYTLQATSRLDINVSATSRITLQPDLTIPVISPLKEHTAKDTFWETQHPQIQDLIRQHRTPRDIYDYVVRTLQYSTQPLTEGSKRLGAVAAFEDPSVAVCQEFTDTFVTLSRAGGIPARRNTGYGYSENEILKPISLKNDVLHAWPEYWSEEKQYWVPVDPTWGSTTGGVDYFTSFDLSHIVFAINGKSSETPYPAGTYAVSEDPSTKDVEVTFASEFPQIQPAFTINLIPKRILGVPIPGMYTAALTNTTGLAWYNLELTFVPVEQDIQILDGKPLTIPVLLPYQTKEMTVTAFTSTLQLPRKTELAPHVSLTNQTIQTYALQPQLITTGPSIVKNLTQRTLLIGLGTSAIVLALITGSVLVLRQRR